MQTDDCANDSESTSDDWIRPNIAGGNHAGFELKKTILSFMRDSSISFFLSISFGSSAALAISRVTCKNMTNLRIESIKSIFWHFSVRISQELFLLSCLIINSTYPIKFRALLCISASDMMRPSDFANVRNLSQSVSYAVGSCFCADSIVPRNWWWDKDAFEIRTYKCITYQYHTKLRCK